MSVFAAAMETSSVPSLILTVVGVGLRLILPVGDPVETSVAMSMENLETEGP